MPTERCTKEEEITPTELYMLNTLNFQEMVSGQRTTVERRHMLYFFFIATKVYTINVRLSPSLRCLVLGD